MESIMKKRYKVALAIFSFVICIKTLGSIYDLRPLCDSGWRSPSIGAQGACSHHGGIDSSAASAANLFSFLVSVFAYHIHYLAEYFKAHVKSLFEVRKEAVIYADTGSKLASKPEAVSEIQDYDATSLTPTIRSIDEVMVENQKFAAMSKDYIEAQMELFEKKSTKHRRRRKY
jgi:hypothetical protein